ncbi:MAG TPA: aryl-sulfate sulfotransferase [Thermoanaerobaculia bacterium]|nr:aryl-sulfate sulfotransferase [Thermoanaerobaculia bacterium]
MSKLRRQFAGWLAASGAVLTLGACAGPPVAENVSLEPGPNPAVPLVGVLTFTSDRPVVPTLVIDDGERRQEVTPDAEPRTEHEVPVLGLRPARVHTVTVTIRDERGRETTLEPLSIETPALPDDTPPIAVTVRRPAAMEPGITMIPVFRWESATDDDPDWGVVLGVDAEGEVVWFYKSHTGTEEVRRKRNGNLMFGEGRDGRVVEMDMVGNVVSTWYSKGVVLDELPDGAIPVDTDVFHHDVIELASGNFLGLGLAVRHFEDFPAEYPPGTKRAPTNVAGDVLIEFRPDGATVRQWNVLDILDPERLGEGSLNQSFYDDQYEGRVDPLPIDISHSNAILYLADEDAAVVSSNSQCVIYKVDLATGELEWLLGDPAGWREPWASKLLQPKGELTWPCHQHGVERTPRGTYLLYDNGGARMIPPNPAMPPDERYSRVVEYRVDEEARTVEEVWSYGPEHERFISPYISDADHLPETGNVLVTDGGRMAGPNGEILGTFGGRQWGRVFELTYGEQPEKVWELVIDDPGGRYAIYRSQRFKSLYPKLDLPTG